VAPDRGEWSASCPGHIIPRRKRPPVPKDRRLSGTRASLEASEKREKKSLTPHLESNHNSLVVQPMA